MRSTAATAMTFEQLAGLELETFSAEFPAAITTVAPNSTAVLIAAWLVLSHAPPPPKLKFNTSAGYGFVGTPVTLPPAAQIIASAMSDV